MRITENTMQPYEQKHAALVRKLAPECTVLLKKDGTFPLSAPCRIAAYGSGIRHTIKGGTGSGDVNIRHMVTIEEGLLNAGFTISSANWLDQYDAILDQNRKNSFRQLKKTITDAGTPASMAILASVGRIIPEPEYHLTLDTDADAAVYVLSRLGGENGDRTAEPGDFLLTHTEIRDILALNQMYEKFILVLNIGGPIDLTPVMEVRNILLLGQLGAETGNVMADILLGKSFPSGKLTATWAPLEAYPSTEGFGDPNNTWYREGIYVGYRWFDIQKENLLFPFAWGLSFTEFSCNTAHISICDKHFLQIDAEVTNTGTFKGKETIQLYISAPGIVQDKPLKELKAFAKTPVLSPGESCKIILRTDIREFTSYDDSRSAWILEQGEYDLLIGSDAAHVSCCGKLQIDQDTVTRQCKKHFSCRDQHKVEKNIPPIENREEKRMLFAKENVPVLHYVFPLSEAETYKTSPSLPIAALVTDNDEVITFSDVLAGSATVEEFAASLTDEELALICTGNGNEITDPAELLGGIPSNIAGASGETTSALREKRQLPEITFVDGPAGVRISSEYTLNEDGRAIPVGMFFGKELLDLLDEEDKELLYSMMGLDQYDTSHKKNVFYQYCTAIPIGVNVAQSFNPELAEQFGDLIGTEMELCGANLFLAPGMNIQRSPLCGRNFEYYSEDPVVSARIAGSITLGVQSHPGCGVTIKHFACNNQETNRADSNSIVSERALREIYLKGFQICIKEAAPWAVMTSYNLLNGEHTCNRHDLVTEVLRDEWGFDGVVMSDWYVTTQISESSAEHNLASAGGCIKAGNNLIMPGCESDRIDILHALKDEKHPYHFTREQLVCAAIPVLQLIQNSCIKTI